MLLFTTIGLTKMSDYQGVKVGSLGRQNERNISYVRLAHTSIFGLCFMSVCLMKSNCYSLIHSSLGRLVGSKFISGLFLSGQGFGTIFVNSPYS